MLHSTLIATKRVMYLLASLGTIARREVPDSLVADAV